MRSASRPRRGRSPGSGEPAGDRAPLQQMRGSVIEALAEAARRDDRGAFDALYDVWFERVYGLAWRILRDRHHAETTTAEIFQRALLLWAEEHREPRRPRARRAARGSSQPRTS